MTQIDKLPSLAPSWVGCILVKKSTLRTTTEQRRPLKMCDVMLSHFVVFPTCDTVTRTQHFATSCQEAGKDPEGEWPCGLHLKSLHWATQRLCFLSSQTVSCSVLFVGAIVTLPGVVFCTPLGLQGIGELNHCRALERYSLKTLQMSGNPVAQEMGKHTAKMN